MPEHAGNAHPQPTQDPKSDTVNVNPRFDGCKCTPEEHCRVWACKRPGERGGEQQRRERRLARERREAQQEAREKEGTGLSRSPPSRSPRALVPLLRAPVHGEIHHNAARLLSPPSLVTSREFPTIHVAALGILRVHAGGQGFGVFLRPPVALRRALAYGDIVSCSRLTGK